MALVGARARPTDKAKDDVLRELLGLVCCGDLGIVNWVGQCDIVKLWYISSAVVVVVAQTISQNLVIDNILKPYSNSDSHFLHVYNNC